MKTEKKTLKSEWQSAFRVPQEMNNITFKAAIPKFFTWAVKPINDNKYLKKFDNLYISKSKIVQFCERNFSCHPTNFV